MKETNINLNALIEEAREDYRLWREQYEHDNCDTPPEAETSEYWIKSLTQAFHAGEAKGREKLGAEIKGSAYLFSEKGYEHFAEALVSIVDGLNAPQEAARQGDKESGV